MAMLNFRYIPYYDPDLQCLSEHTKTLIVAFADEIQAGRYPFLGYGTVDLGTRRSNGTLTLCSVKSGPMSGASVATAFATHGSDVQSAVRASRLQFLPILGKAHVLPATNSIASRPRSS